MSPLTGLQVLPPEPEHLTGNLFDSYCENNPSFLHLH